MMQAMIFAAGLGTRLRPLTDHRPKALVEVGGKTLLARTLKTLKDAGAERIVVNVHHFAEQIISALKEEKNVKISHEKEHLLNTGGGLKKAQPLFLPDENILIHNVDIISNTRLKDFYYSHTSEIDALLLISKRKSNRQLLFNKEMRLVGWVKLENTTSNNKTEEKIVEWKILSNKNENSNTKVLKQGKGDIEIKSYLTYAFSGIHSFSPRLFNEMSNFPDEFSIIDFYLEVCAKYNIKGYVQEDLSLTDVGKIEVIKSFKP